MRKTCANCSHYHNTMGDEQKDFHFHDYCDIWQTIIPSNTIFDRENCLCGYDDIECGIAYCWAFEEAEKEWPFKFENMDENERYEEC